MRPRLALVLPAAGALCAALTLVVAGCGGDDSASEPPATEAPPAETQPPETEPEAEPPAGEALAGLPDYTAGYEGWTKLNDESFDTPGAHNGLKDVYVSQVRDGDLYPEGTVIVKSIADEGATGPPRDVAVMRKVDGEWEYVEYTTSGDRYDILAEGAICQSCHMQAAADDYVFTKG